MPETFTPEQIAQILEAFFATVGTRQYIGARYVPIFGRKDEESIIWDNSAPYEPLTIVLYQGNSFTSRQYVPAGVEITNEEFWAETGNYNAQIEQYRQLTLLVSEKVNSINDALPISEFSPENTVYDTISNTISDVVGEGFSPENTVSDAISTLNTNTNDISNAIGTGFDAENTVANAIAENQNQLQNPSILPCSLDSIEEIGQLQTPTIMYFQGAVWTNDYMYVGMYASSTASALIGKFDTTDYTLVDTCELNERAHCNSLSFDPNTQKLIVSGNQNGKMYVINTSDMSIAKTIDIGDSNIQGFCVGSNGTAIAALTDSNEYVIYDHKTGTFVNHLYAAMGITMPYAAGVSGRQQISQYKTGFVRLQSNRLAGSGLGRVKPCLVIMTARGACKYIVTMPYIDVELESVTTISDTEFILTDLQGKVYRLDASSALGTLREFNELTVPSLQYTWLAPSLTEQLSSGMTVQVKSNVFVQRYIPILQEMLYGGNLNVAWNFPGSFVSKLCRSNATYTQLHSMNYIYTESGMVYYHNQYNVAERGYRLAVIEIVNVATNTQYKLEITIEEARDVSTFAQKISDFIDTLPSGLFGVSNTYPMGAVGFGASPYSASNSLNIDLSEE